MKRPLRIAVFVHAFPKVSETFVLNQVTGLLDMGHDVTVFAVEHGGDNVRHAEFDRYQLAARTRVPDMARHPAGRIATGGRIALDLLKRKPGVTVRSLNAFRYGRLSMSLRLLHWAGCLADEAPFDIIHAHFGPLGVLAARLREAGLLTGRLVTVFHGVDMTVYVRNGARKYAHLFRNGDLFLPISKVWRDKLADFGCDPSRTFVHHMGVDLETIPFRARERRPGHPLRLLSVGRLVEKKGIDDALFAVAEVAKETRDLRYTIIGDGPLREELEDLSESLGIADLVTFTGWCDHAGVTEAMNAHDILLAPSVTSRAGDQEGIPVTLMEAMAAGMVVISTKHSGIPELVEDGRSGVLVGEGDVRALSAELAVIARSGAAWPRISWAARQRVSDAFNVTTLNRQLVRYFETLLRDQPDVGGERGLGRDAPEMAAPVPAAPVN